MGHGLATLTTTLAAFGLAWLAQSTALLAFGLLVGRLLARSGPAVQSGIYRTTLAAVLVCPFAAALLSGTGYEGLTFRLPTSKAGAAPARSLPIAASGTSAVTTEAGMRPGPSDALRYQEPFSKPIVEVPDESALSVGSAPLPAAPAKASLFVLAAAMGLSVWLFGSVILGVRLLVGQRRMARLRATAMDAGPTAMALCRDLAGRLGVTAPDVLRSPFLPSPCLDGLRRPAILLPEGDDGDHHETFVHELAHLVRRDGLWNLLRRMTVAACWIQPLLWILSRRLEATAEEVCDDYVVQFGADRTRYASHLVELAGRALLPIAPAGVGMVSLRTMLARRVVRILDDSRALSTRAGARAVAVMGVVGLGGTALAGLIGVHGGAEAFGQSPPKAGESRAEAVAAPAEPVAATTARANPTDVPITGRIVDLEGRPVAGASVKTSQIRVPKSGNLTPWIEGIKRGEPPWIVAKHVDANREAREAVRRKATTDADGRFRLEGLGAERVVKLTVEGGTIAATSIDVATRRMEPIPARGFRNQHGPGFRSIYGADFTFTAAPSRPIEGVLKDAETGRPLVGTEVRSNRFAGSDFVGTETLKTRTDAQGRFRLSGMPKGQGNRILIVPDDEQPYLVQEVDVPDPPGVAPVSVEVALPRGIWIEGMLTEQATGKPVPGARLHYMPFLENRFAQAHPAFDEHGNSDNSDIQDRYQTKNDGTFRLVGLPGRAVVGAIVYDKAYLQGAGSEAIAGLNKSGHFETYRSPINPGRLWPTVMKEIDPPADAGTVRVDLQVTTGPSVRLSIVDAAGEPVTDIATGGLQRRGTYERDHLASSQGEVANLVPDEERTVVLRHVDRKIGKVVRVRKGDDANGPVVARLEPLAVMIGRVVDADGNPVSGARVRPDLLPFGDFSMHLPEVMTDEQGRFVVPDVAVGCDYAIAVESPGSIKERKFAFLKQATVRPGETTDVGEIRFKSR